MDMTTASLQSNFSQDSLYSTRENAISNSDAPQLAVRTTESTDNTHFSQHTARTSDSFAPSNPIQHKAEEGRRYVAASFEAGVGRLTDTII